MLNCMCRSARAPAKALQTDSIVYIVETKMMVSSTEYVLS